MIALIVVAILGLYLLISILFVRWVVRRSRLAGRNARYWGAGAALFMYLLVFWDHIPVLLLHRYYCSKDAGFWAYQTVEDWMAANPGIDNGFGPKQLPIDSKWKPGFENSHALLTDGTEVWLSKGGAITQFRRVNGTRGYWINERLLVELENKDNFAHSISREEQRLVDDKTKLILARSVNYWRGKTGQFAMGFNSLSDFKLWLGWGDRECSGNEVQSFGSKLGLYSNRFAQYSRREK
jgi:hypothetical protein